MQEQQKSFRFGKWEEWREGKVFLPWGNLVPKEEHEYDESCPKTKGELKQT